MNLDTTTPEVFMTPMALEPCSLNQMWSSGPVAMVSAEVMGDPTPWARRSAAGRSNSWMTGPTALGVISPMRLAAVSVNHRLPFGPTVMPSRPGTLLAKAGTGYEL